MRPARILCRAAAALSLLALLASACGSSSHPAPPGAAGSKGSGASGGLDLGNLPDDFDDDCAGDLIEAKRVPLDMYVMLDVSGSMLEVTEGDDASTKWQAVSSALADFVRDEASAGIGMGLQVFPIRDPDAPASCTNSQQCGQFGPCFRNLCDALEGVAICDTNQDCGLFGGDCVPFGYCEGDQTILCAPAGLPCGDDAGEPLGDCVQPVTSPCLTTADCRPATYAAPASPIVALPAARDGLLRTLQMAAPDPDGATPTGPALQGAIEQASSWAAGHPKHQVVAVLATDGIPTECLPVQIDEVSAIAAAGSNASPAISTFVIGVVGTDDDAAPGNLDAIALAGGTQSAFIVDSQGDVAAQFRAALNEIRGSRLSCDLLVPETGAGRPVDYDFVNVVLDDGTGSAPQTIPYVMTAEGCEAAGTGWYFDKEPAAGVPPEHILVCPQTCARFEQVDRGSVQIKLGCARRVPA